MPYPYQIKSLDEYHETYRRSIEDPEAFWAGIAGHFRWKNPHESILDWNFKEPRVQWFRGAKLNITENCLDRWAEIQPDAIALIWESNFKEETHRQFTYAELLFLVNQFAHVLQQNGIQKGDRVCIYMPMVPELAIAVLACARIGAIHSVVFGGFSVQSVADRIQDASCNMVITADGAYRGAKEIGLKKVIDEALVFCPTVERCIVLRRTGCEVDMHSGRDRWWHDEIAKIEALGNPPFEAESMDAEDPLFILYTSGSTGKPKGVVHSSAGYMIYTNYTFVNVFQYQPGDIHFCTADIGWVTGHSYILYGPLSAGATTLMFEGVPTWPDEARLWDIVDKFRVNILYTAPTAIRSLMSFGTELLEQKELSSLKVLGSVGEPINEEAWHWFDQYVGKGRCPIVDTWWQTETGGIMISNLAGVTPQKPGCATLPLPGIQPVLLDEHGNIVSGSSAATFETPGDVINGNLCIQFPWPSILRTTYGDHERCRSNYFATYPGMYFTGDGCLRDENGYYRITGRVDDVLNVSGHRIGTAEVENAIDLHKHVIESAVVGYGHEIKGQGIYAFVFYNGELTDREMMRKEIRDIVAENIGHFAKPDKIQFVTGLPKTRSGKIMRRILRKIAEGEMENFGDISTLLDPAVVADIASGRIG